MHFKLGEKVSFLREAGEGTIVGFKDSSTAIVIDETGFEREYLTQFLVKICGTIDEITEVINKDGNSGYFKQVSQDTPLNVSKHNDYWEIDLHSHNIVKSELGLSNGEILMKQLDEFKRFYNNAVEKYIRKLIVIHGVGGGVLKSEIHLFLNGREGVDYYDADFRNYGKGATEIRIFYNY